MEIIFFHIFIFLWNFFSSFHEHSTNTLFLLFINNNKYIISDLDTSKSTQYNTHTHTHTIYYNSTDTAVRLYRCQLNNGAHKYTNTHLEAEQASNPVRSAAIIDFIFSVTLTETIAINTQSTLDADRTQAIKEYLKN